MEYAIVLYFNKTVEDKINSLILKIAIEYFEVLEIETNRIGLIKCNPYKNIKVWEI